MFEKKSYNIVFLSHFKYFTAILRDFMMKKLQKRARLLVPRLQVPPRKLTTSLHFLLYFFNEYLSS